MGRARGRAAEQVFGAWRQPLASPAEGGGLPQGASGVISTGLQLDKEPDWRSTVSTTFSALLSSWSLGRRPARRGVGGQKIESFPYSSEKAFIEA